MSSSSARTHRCAELSIRDEGVLVRLVGWADTIRSHGGITFVDLRDRWGLVQLRIESSQGSDLADAIQDMHRESVLEVRGNKVMFDHLEFNFIQFVHFVGREKVYAQYRKN